MTLRIPTYITQHGTNTKQQRKGNVLQEKVKRILLRRGKSMAKSSISFHFTALPELILHVGVMSR